MSELHNKKNHDGAYFFECKNVHEIGRESEVDQRTGGNQNGKLLMNNENTLKPRTSLSKNTYCCHES